MQGRSLLRSTSEGRVISRSFAHHREMALPAPNPLKFLLFAHMKLRRLQFNLNLERLDLRVSVDCDFPRIN